jgi:hypothetical protein
MARIAAFEWHGKEYSSDQRSPDWYWALGIVAAALIVICILFGNVLLSVVVLVAAVAVGLQAAKHSRIHRYTLTERELIIDDVSHPYDTMLSYSVLEYLDDTLPPALSIKTDTILTPHLLIPLPVEDADDIYEYLLQHVPHEEHAMTFADYLIRLFRF